MAAHDACNDARFTIGADGWRRWSGGQGWRQSAQGAPIYLEGEDAPPRTSGRPLTALTNWTDSKADLLAACARFPSIHPATALATLLVEAWPPKGRLNHRSAHNAREEPGYRSDAETPDRVSYGKGHTLLSTAQSMEDEYHIFGERPDMWALWQPSRSLAYMVAYLHDQAERYGTLDPMLLQSAYNRGKLAVSERTKDGPNPLLLSVFGGNRHRRFIEFHNDFVLGVDWTRELGVWP